MKIAVCTTFPNNYWNICAAEMVASFKAHWPEDIKLFIQLDEQSHQTFTELNNKIVTIANAGTDKPRAFIASAWAEDQKAFMERWKDHRPESYMFDAVRFSHKVFALEKCADALDFDYLIWLDADVITKKQITYDWLKEVLPSDEVVSYLGRPYIGYSECGFVAYNLKHGGRELLKEMKAMYVSDEIKKLQAYTDCHVLDYCLIGKKSKNLSEHCTKQQGLDVWIHTKLAEKMVHRKGNRKIVAAENRQARQDGVTDLNNLKIQTKNCIDHDKIRANVNANLGQIRLWATVLKPTNQEIVLCAAGPSLVNHIQEIKKLKSEGAYVITVKHAIDTLKAHDIKPDACVLLDPRGHVEKFVREPDPDVVYFVASMVDPSVVKTLNDNRCTVVGYHAAVNAGEFAEMIPTDMPISGGSATSTRTIHMFADMFGFKTFHLFGYDLSHQKKPDLNKKNEDGQPQVFEETFKVASFAGKTVERTFWTEGQFLAQAQELRNLYKERKDIKLNFYGDGMAAWMVRHQRLYDQYVEEYNRKISEVRANSITLEDFINAATRANQFSRRIIAG